MTRGRALMIGVDTGLAAQLRGAGNDVELMLTEICACYELEPEATLRDRDATRDGILAALDRFLGSATDEEVLLFYFAGHGTRVDSALDDGSVREALCPHDFSVENPDVAICDVELHDRFLDAQGRGARLTAIFDCCFSGGLPDESVRAASGSETGVRGIADSTNAGLRGGVAASPRKVHRIIDVPRPRKGVPVVVFAACLADALAREHRFGKRVRGVFTHHLTEAVQRLGRGASNGCLRDAIEAGILADAQLGGYVQIPVLAPASQKDAEFLGLARRAPFGASDG